MARRVAVFGGGIAGLTVAHECAAAGLEVEVFERDPHLGGKAFSARDEVGRPFEHSVRTYGGTYWFLYDTLKRIPDPARGAGHRAFDNLVPLPALRLVTRTAEASLLCLHRVPPREKALAFLGALRAFGVPRRDVAYFVTRIVRFVASSDARRTALGRTSFAEEFGLERRSPALARVVTALAEIAVAAKPAASATLLLDLFARVLAADAMTRQGVASSMNVMNGPTSERFIEPWGAELARLGVRLRTGAGLSRLDVDGGRVRRAMLDSGDEVVADAYVLALHHDGLRAVAPQLSSQTLIRGEWSGGAQLYLSHIPDELARAHTFTLVLDSPWRIIYLLQAPPVWAGVALPPGVAGVLSIAFSEVNAPGIVHHRAFTQCTPAEIVDELLAQIGLASRECVVGSHLDPLLRRVPDAEYRAHPERWTGWEAASPTPDGYRWLSRGALYIASPASFGQEPTCITAIDGLFLAGEFVGTRYLVPTMERASESGRRCAQAVCDHLAVRYDGLPEAPPMPLGWLRALDAWLYRLGHPRRSRTS